MRSIFIPTTSAEDWRRLLADPQKQWKTGFSAKALAYCWENQDGFPPEVARLFLESGIDAFQELELLVALPEYKVPLPGGKKPSQNDLFILAKGHYGQLISITVEGKVTESFGPTLGEWGADKSPGKKRRLKFIQELLQLRKELPPQIRYQLLHRIASAVIEATRFNARYAAMIVHSFSQADQGLDDYQRFLGLFVDMPAAPNKLIFLKETKGINLYCGWARGNENYLKV